MALEIGEQLELGLVLALEPDLVLALVLGQEQELEPGPDLLPAPFAGVC